jgi:hypothetical protein
MSFVSTRTAKPDEGKHNGVTLDTVEQETQVLRGPLLWQSYVRKPWRMSTRGNRHHRQSLPKKVKPSCAFITITHSFIDYCSPDQTILRVVIDIASPQWQALIARSVRCFFKSLIDDDIFWTSQS